MGQGFIGAVPTGAGRQGILAAGSQGAGERGSSGPWSNEPGPQGVLDPLTPCVLGVGCQGDGVLPPHETGRRRIPAANTPRPLHQRTSEAGKQGTGNRERCGSAYMMLTLAMI